MKALKNGVVFAVGRQESHAFTFSSFDDMGTAEHKEFFIGQCNVLARFDRGEGGAKTGCADDGDEHDVGFSKCGQLCQSCFATTELCAYWEITGLLREGIGRLGFKYCVANIEFMAYRRQLFVARL